MRQSPELRTLMLRFNDALNAGDAAFLDRHTSRAPGTRFIGTDPGEVWDREDALRAMGSQIEAGLRVEAGALDAYVDGDVGWVIDPAARFRFADRDIPFRLSTIFRREGNEWRLVHWHCSVGIPNAEVVGQELPR